jgi:patatin-related protein
MSTQPTMDIGREIRFSVVLYGGVSLAIYINGVTQELFQLARATAQNPDKPVEPLCGDNELSRTAGTYRKLAQILSLSPAERQALEKSDSIAAGKPVSPDGLPHSIGVKFVIDTISGTSAGGINGIFLGKALAHNQSLDSLQALWIKEGDIGSLINDSQSIKDLAGFPSPNPPESLLNGQRMYRRLVEALDTMDNGATDSPKASGYVNELDVFITTTDVNGLPVYLRLADGIVTERRYKNVFQFSYPNNESPTKSDFDRSHNSFLAYAARCTSSFPVAFAPMRLEGVGDVLTTMTTHLTEGKLGQDRARWQRFFPAYQPSTEEPGNPAWYEFEKRPFCDGGYLDNKPFSYAIEELPQRVSRLPVERKLIYVEPDPENAVLARDPSRVPNAIENAWLAESLASYETIREDLERVLARNRLIERVDRLLAGSDEDVRMWRKANTFTDNQLFLKGDFGELIAKYGPSYGGYHRLKVAALTDEIGSWFGAAAGFLRTSAYVLAIRLLIRAWRERTYSMRESPPPATAASPGAVSPEATRTAVAPVVGEIQAAPAVPTEPATPAAPAAAPAAPAVAPAAPAVAPAAPAVAPAAPAVTIPVNRPAPDHLTEPWFLFDFDLSYRIRRLRFVMKRLDATCLASLTGRPAGASMGIVQELAQDVSADKSIMDKLDGLRSGLQTALEALIRTRDNLKSAGKQNPLTNLLDGDAIPGLNILENVLSGRTFDERFAKAQAVVANDTVMKAIDRCAVALREEVSNAAVSSSDSARGALVAAVNNAKHPEELRVMQQMYSFYEDFQGYDFVSFPVMYATDIGEELATTDVIRVSPQDATRLVDPEKGDNRRKLAGTTLFHFGAFLEEKWRRNDMLWGRLDGAERLIVSLMPQDCPKLCDALVKEAQTQILAEYFSQLNAQTLLDFSAAVVGRLDQFPAPADKLREFFNSTTGAGGAIALPQVLQAALSHSLGPDKLLEFFGRADGYQVSMDPTATRSGAAIARGTTVIGRMLSKIGDDLKFQPGNRFGTWVARSGQILWGFVEVATPGRLQRLFGRYWLKVAYLFEALLILGGTLLGHPDAAQLGWTLLAATIGANLIAWLISDWFTGRSNALRILRLLAILVTLGLAALGAYTAFDWVHAGQFGFG